MSRYHEVFAASKDDPESFWADAARDIDWYKAWDKVFDPYAGVGSSLIAALKHGRCAMGAEKEEKYIRIANDRISLFLNGTLPIRSMGKPVHKPTGKAAQVPSEWEVV